MATLNERFETFTKQGRVLRREDGQELDGKTADDYCAICLLITKQGQTKPDLVVCPYTSVPDGVVTGLANDAATLNDMDPQGLIADNINILYQDIHRDDEVILCLGSGRGASINNIACIDHDNAGYVEAMAENNESIAQVPPYRMLGRFMDTYTAVANKAQLAWVKGK